MNHFFFYESNIKKLDPKDKVKFLKILNDEFEEEEEGELCIPTH